MPYWNFEPTKAVIYTVVKVGGGTGQDPATVFFQCIKKLVECKVNCMSNYIQIACFDTWARVYMHLIHICICKHLGYSSYASQLY